jgi:hypothetical protein
MRETSESKLDIAAEVVSHDGYSDVWPAFFELWLRFWSDAPYPLNLISDRVTFLDAHDLPGYRNFPAIAAEKGIREEDLSHNAGT